MIIAIDGTAASGKGTLGITLAMRLGLDYLDTGQLYRAVGLAVKQAGVNPEDASDETLKKLINQSISAKNLGPNYAALKLVNWHQKSLPLHKCVPVCWKDSVISPITRRMAKARFWMAEILEVLYYPMQTQNSLLMQLPIFGPPVAIWN